MTILQCHRLEFAEREEAVMASIVLVGVVPVLVSGRVGGRIAAFRVPRRSCCNML